MPDYLLDCNHLSASLRRVSPVRERIHQGRRAGHRFISCYPVLCELEVGIQQTPNPDDNRRRLAQLLRHVRLWPLDTETTRLYGAVYLELRRQGRVLSQVDIMLVSPLTKLAINSRCSYADGWPWTVWEVASCVGGDQRN